MAAIPSLSLNIPPFFLAEHRQPSNILVKIKKRKKIGVIREEACSVPIVTVFRRRAKCREPESSTVPARTNTRGKHVLCGTIRYR